MSVAVPSALSVAVTRDSSSNASSPAGSGKAAPARTRKLAYPLAIHLPAGQTQMIELGGHRKATGIRVSTGGKGTFDVYVH